MGCPSPCRSNRREALRARNRRRRTVARVRPGMIAATSPGAEPGRAGVPAASGIGAEGRRGPAEELVVGRADAPARGAPAIRLDRRLRACILLQGVSSATPRAPNETVHDSPYDRNQRYRRRRECAAQRRVPSGSRLLPLDRRRAGARPVAGRARSERRPHPHRRVEALVGPAPPARSEPSLPGGRRGPDPFAPAGSEFLQLCGGHTRRLQDARDLSRPRGIQECPLVPGLHEAPGRAVVGRVGRGRLRCREERPSQSRVSALAGGASVQRHRRGRVQLRWQRPDS